MHGTFVYIPGLSFTFRGDDDVWVYMNGKLVIDLGGVHNPMVGTYEIDNLNLTEGLEKLHKHARFEALLSSPLARVGRGLRPVRRSGGFEFFLC